MLKDSTIRRFWEYAKPNKHGYLEWTGGKGRYGYGRLGRTEPLGPETEYAHRIAYEIYHGEPPPNFVCHRCDRPACVDKRCLFSGTHHENILDAARKGRMPRGERCPASVLTERDVAEIRQVAPFLTRTALAAAYGVSATTISNVATRESWAWLP